MKYIARLHGRYGEQCSIEAESLIGLSKQLSQTHMQDEVVTADIFKAADDTVIGAGIHGKATLIRTLRLVPGEDALNTFPLLLIHEA